jgi:hypothetical protein
MHSACHQVEEGTVLNSTHYSHPSISSSIPKHESIRLKFFLLPDDLTPWTLESLNPFFDKNGGVL